MRVSLFCGVDMTSVAAATARVRLAQESGYDGAWFAQGYSLDALTAGSQVPDISLGTAVVPVQGRHPIPLALCALTAADAAGPGRVTLGIGATHKPVSEGAFNIPYSEMVDRCRDVLVALHGLFGEERAVDYDGTSLSAHAKFPATGMVPPRLVLAALGPKMLALAGQYTDGTVTWMTGPTTLGRDVVPTLQRAADAHGRQASEVVVGLPVCITDDPAGARERIGGTMTFSAGLPSYRRMLAAEGVDEPVDIALIGPPDQVAERIDALRQAGMTELLANVQGTPEEQERTVEVLPGLTVQ
jgi:F420-dependent oxidoreductase-like protein